MTENGSIVSGCGSVVAKGESRHRHRRVRAGQVQLELLMGMIMAVMNVMMMVMGHGLEVRRGAGGDGGSTEVGLKVFHDGITPLTLLLQGSARFQRMSSFGFLHVSVVLIRVGLGSAHIHVLHRIVWGVDEAVVHFGHRVLPRHIQIGLENLEPRRLGPDGGG